MNILTKYICKEFLKMMVLCQAIFLGIYLTIDFIQKIDNFIDADSSIVAAFGYFIYKTPFIAVQLVPVTSMLAVILTFCLMEKNREITAMKTSGVSVLKFSSPIIILSVLVAAFVFLFSELVVPYASTKSSEIWSNEVDKDDSKRFYGHKHIWYKARNAIYEIGFYDADKQIMENPVFYFFDDSFRLIRRIDGMRGVWKGSAWIIQEGIMQILNLDGEYISKRFEQLKIDIPERPSAFVKREKKPEEMGYWQLKRYANRVQSEGYNATHYLVEMNIKLAYPFVNVIMILIGIPIAMGVKGRTPLAVSLGIVGCFFYLLVFGISRSFGLSGILPPVISAWLANAIYIFLGAYLMIHVRT